MERDLFSDLNKEESENTAKKEAPLAERMRPQNLEDVEGQNHLIGEGKPLSRLKGNALPSIILWGPPGSGKTTLARVLAKGSFFKQISAVLSGVKDLRALVDVLPSGKTVLFVDEIHRWNKAQQDALLPHLEDGTITLIGATTENPSFSLTSPLMSRCKLFVLKPLDKKAIRNILKKALRDEERGLGAFHCTIEESAWNFLENLADGDARHALNTLEILAKMGQNITGDFIAKAMGEKHFRYYQKGEEHYNLISALIKSMRGSDPDAAIYYLARMYEAGEDPRFLTRRLIIFASEDVGNADPRALSVAVASAEAFDRIGQAEGWIPLAQAVTYLATASKSNASYMAYKEAKAEVEESGSLEVPLHLRNAVTKSMKDCSYGKGYEYAHNQNRGFVSHKHLPEEISEKNFYKVTNRGYEKIIKERLDWIKGTKSSSKTTS